MKGGTLKFVRKGGLNHFRRFLELEKSSNLVTLTFEQLCVRIRFVSTQSFGINDCTDSESRDCRLERKRQSLPRRQRKQPS